MRPAAFTFNSDTFNLNTFKRVDEIVPQPFERGSIGMARVFERIPSICLSRSLLFRI